VIRLPIRFPDEIAGFAIYFFKSKIQDYSPRLAALLQFTISRKTGKNRTLFVQYSLFAFPGGVSVARLRLKNFRHCLFGSRPSESV
jgi:hypothetical protein